MRTLLSLGGIGLLCALLLAGVQDLTGEAIDRNRNAHAWRTAFELTGKRFDTNGLEWREGRLRLPDGGWLQRSATPGYVGDIHLLAAFNAKGRLTGARVVRHRETPGLGDFIDLDKSPWMRRFSESSPRAVDAVTGATITSEAVKRGVERMIEAQKMNSPSAHPPRRLGILNIREQRPQDAQRGVVLVPPQRDGRLGTVRIDSLVQSPAFGIAAKTLAH